MRKLQSYLMGAWREGAGEGVAIRDAATGRGALTG
jgi:oxepin-CoA hydrolase/3-oxo-5,6-dehydrosuberyl-CoA semialdehyde dehydrogenase